MRTVAVLSSFHDPTKQQQEENENVPLSQQYSTAGSSAGAQSIATGPATPQTPTASREESPYKVYELPATKPSFLSFPTAASVFGSTVGTFVLNNYLNLGPIKASSVAALVATMILPEKLATAALCGSFAGMAKVAVIPGLTPSALLGLLCAVLLSLFDYKKWLLGMGGRLGLIAQCACTSQFIFSSIFLSVATTSSPEAALIGRVSNWKQVVLQLPQVSAFTVIGALFMKYWKKFLAGTSKQLSTSVAAVGATGLVSSILLPASFVGPAFCGSFVAMSAPSKLPTVVSLIWASVLAGISQQALAGVMLGGWGGKLGTAAFMGVLAYTQMIKKFTPVLVEETNPKMAEVAVPRPSSDLFLPHQELEAIAAVEEQRSQQDAKDLEQPQENNDLPENLE